MKFILENSKEKTDVWLVTTDMVRLFEKNGIRYSELAELGKKINKLTSDEVGSFFLLQNLMSKRLGKPVAEINIPANSEVESNLLRKFVLENTDAQQYFIELLQQHPMYFYRQTDDALLLMIADKGSAENDFPSWTLLEGDKFSIAIVDLLYKTYGYQSLHMHSVIQVAENEFTLSNAFYALEQEL